MRTKKQINILSLAEWDYAGVGYQLAKAINETSLNSSAAIRWNTSYIKYPHEFLQPRQGRIIELWKQADVIHIHDGFYHLPNNLQAKPTLITYHGSIFRRAHQKNLKMCAENTWYTTVSTLDLTLLGKVGWLPDTRFEYQVKDKHDAFTVCHAPTSRPGKSTELVIEACKKLGVKLELIEKTDWNDCLARKSRCHLLVDQFKLGYGCNAIEAWSMKIPVVANADKPILDKMNGTFEAIPFLQSMESVKPLCDAIAIMRDSENEREYFGNTGYSHFKRYHSPEASTIYALDYYHKAIELFWSRKPDSPIEQVRIATKGLPNREGMILIRYIGGNIGTETYLGEVTNNKYEFSDGNPLRYVDARDVPHLLSITARQRSRKKIFREE